jgi:hypothetical protein
VNYSLNGGLTWATPSAVPGGALEAISGNTTTDDISTIVAYNGHVGIMWSHQKENNLSQPTGDPSFNSGGVNCSSSSKAIPDKCSPRVASDTDHLTSITVNFAVHDDGADPSAWSSDAIFTASGDDHVNVKAYDGHVYAAFKTAFDTKVIRLLDCGAGVSGCKTKTDWKDYTVYNRKDNSGNSPEAKLNAANSTDATRPIVLIDTEHREVYVFVNVQQGAAKQQCIRYKKTSIDAINFPDDDGIPFITTDVNLNDATSAINDPTSTKQNVNSTTGLVVLGSDAGQLRYFHNYLALK